MGIGGRALVLLAMEIDADFAPRPRATIRAPTPPFFESWPLPTRLSHPAPNEGNGRFWKADGHSADSV